MKKEERGGERRGSFVKDATVLPVRFSSVQSLSHVRFFGTPWIAAHQASLSITNSRSSLRLMSIESVMPSSHLILCRPLLLLPPISPSIRVFSNESTLCMRLNYPPGRLQKISLVCQSQGQEGIDYLRKYSISGVWKMNSTPDLGTHWSLVCLTAGLEFLHLIVVQSLSHVRLFATPWTAARQASLSLTISWSWLKLLSIESIMLSNRLILCHLSLLLPSLFPSIRVFFQRVSSSNQVAKVLEL